ncbi:3'-5' exoribonuclease [Salsuginibacillus halophilus]|uniref:3'-5' exoribonuclease n=1 Tax=Salsuginibacillus halophilus TaxID=517424 RepID=A0A2P8HEA4_9BACI|nr:OB-fold nucleic acid binding domain-containing protein [Salsuginibacillus halophilus]PSL44567.1 3'-5' exoribonuclease [Salsuginibacillus halophilus]
MSEWQTKQAGERVIQFFVIQDRAVKTASNQSEYMHITLSDASGTLQARLWDVTEKQKEAFQPRMVVKVDGRIEFFRGIRELHIYRIRLATEEDQLSMEQLVPHARRSKDEMWREIIGVIEQVKSPVLSRVLKTVANNRELRDALTSYPASKAYHHAYYAGLLEHMVTLSRAVRALSPVYEVNRDEMLALCILHDAGKVRKFSNAAAPQVTKQGELFGHLILSSDILLEAADEAGISRDHPEIETLRHSILSHYGDVENGWGSPVSGRTREAVLFHYLDQLDSKLSAMSQAAESASDTARGVYVPMLKRNMYAGEDLS